MRQTVEGVLVVHDHGHPHILMLQIANAFFKLPGEYLKPGEEEIQGLKNRLDERLAPSPSSTFQFTEQHGIGNDWEIGDCLAQWWRPNFETFMVSPIYWTTVHVHSACTYARMIFQKQRHALGPFSGCTLSERERATD